MSLDLTPVLICLIIFGSIASLFVAPAYFKSRERQNLQNTLRSAIDKGADLPPEVIEALTTDTKRPPSRVRDLRNAVIWLAISAAIVTIGVIHAIDEQSIRESTMAFALACLPGFIGLAFLGFALLNKDRK